MYNQEIVLFIHDFINKSISEMDRITNLHVNDISIEVDKTKERLVASLKADFEPFLDGNFSSLEQIIGDGLIHSVGSYPDTIRYVDKFIANHYKRIEMVMQEGLSKLPTIAAFRILLANLQNEMSSKIQEVTDDKSKEVINGIEQEFLQMQVKLVMYFKEIGLTSQDVCDEIIQKVDIFQSNLLLNIEDKVPALTFLGFENARVLLATVDNKMSEPIVLTDTIPGVPMFKI